MNETFNRKYNELIAPLYGSRRDKEYDKCLLSDNVIPHTYSIEDRVDMTNYATYSIDPDGCEDADDAFSIYTENDKLFLAIHIADPTEFINPYSTLWKDIEKRVVTRYPSNQKPIHMIPEEIMEKSSLMSNDYGDIKNAITILTEISTSTFKPVNRITLLFTKVKVSKENSLSYVAAGDLLESGHYEMVNGEKICDALISIRQEIGRAHV